MYGAYTGLVYFSPVFGGWFADNKIGCRKAIMIGGVIMAIAEFTIAFRQTDFNIILGMLLMIIGNGLFKPNISTLLGELYRGEELFHL